MSLCLKLPSINVESSKTAAYCKQHAEDGMVNVRARRSSHDCCTTGQARGAPTCVAATACFPLKSDILGCSAVKYEASWEVTVCRKRSRGELNGEQPTHCLDHGPLRGGGVHTVGMGRCKGVSSPYIIFPCVTGAPQRQNRRNGRQAGPSRYAANRDPITGRTSVWKSHQDRDGAVVLF